MSFDKIHIYPKEELLAAWERDRERFTPDVVDPPRCLRCGRPLDRHFSVNALSRALDVHICGSCGTAEALGDWTGNVLPLWEWDAVRNDLLEPVDRHAYACWYFQSHFQRSSKESALLCWASSCQRGSLLPFRL